MTDSTVEVGFEESVYSVAEGETAMLCLLVRFTGEPAELNVTITTNDEDDNKTG